MSIISIRLYYDFLNPLEIGYFRLTQACNCSIVVYNLPEIVILIITTWVQLVQI